MKLLASLLLFASIAHAQQISALSSRTGAVGDVVAVYGSGLTGATSVKFGTVSASATTVVNDNQINATVPSGFSTGNVSVIYPTATLYSGHYFSVANSTTLTVPLNNTRVDARFITDTKAGTTVLWGQGLANDSVLPYLIQTSTDNSVAGSIDWTGRFVWPGLQNWTGYLVFASTSAGSIYVRIDTGNVINTAIRNTLTASPLLIAGAFQGDEVEWRLTYEAAASDEYFVEYKVNGVACLDCRASQGTAAGPAIPTPTAFSIGTGNGVTNMLGTPTYFSATPHTALPGSSGYEIVVIGDSTTSGAQNTSLQQWRLTPAGIYKPSERWTRPGIYSFAHIGDQISAQQGKWDASTLKGTAAIKAFILGPLGVNDIRGIGSDGPTTVAAIQTLINDVHTANPTAKIILVQIPPMKSYCTAPQWTAIQFVNSAISSFSSSFTNVDAAVTSHYSILSNGSDDYLPWYGVGDLGHENNEGRQVLATAQRAVLVSLGVLPP